MRECKLLSLVVPCYNEEETIRETYKRLDQITHEWINRRLISNCEIIFVDDGSKDSTLNALKGFAEANKRVKIISLSKNFGHQGALYAGLYNAKGDAIVSLDADLQDPPEVIAEMIQKYKEGAEIVLGVRDDRTTDSIFKRFTAEFFYGLMKIMGANLVHNHADFRLLSQKALEELKNFPESVRFLRGIIPALGFDPALVYYKREARFAGKTKYPFRKMFAFAVDGITSFSYFPLRLASITGIIIAIGSLVLALWAVITKLLGHAVPGWTSTVLPMYFLGGIQLLFLGIIGEYIGKIYMETKRRPAFIIKEKTNF